MTITATIVIIAISIFGLCCLGCAIWFFRDERKRRAALETANKNNRELQDQLDVANKNNRELQDQLDVANSEIDNLKIRLADTEAAKRDAQWLSHLSMVTFQSTVGVLCSSQRRFAVLKKDHDQTVKNYLEFYKKVKEQGEARLVRKGAAIALSFFPGAGLLDILVDVGEGIVGVAEISGDIIDASKALGGFTDGIAIEFPEPMTDANLIQDAQSTFSESFKETFGEDIGPDCVGALDGAKLETFLTNMLQSTAKLIIKSVEEAYFNGVFEKIDDFVDEFQDYRELLEDEPKQEEEQKENNDDSETN